MKVKAVIFALVSVFFTGSLIQSWAAEKLKFAVPTKANPLYSLANMAAEERGTWKAAGLNLETFVFTGGAPMARAIAAGSVNTGLHSPVFMLLGLVRGVATVVVADASRDQYVLIVLRDSPIRGIKDLKGAKIGVTRLGGLFHVFGRAIENSLGMGKQFKFLGMGGVTSNVAGLKAGAIDASLTSFLNAAPLLVVGEIRKVLVVRDYLPKPWAYNVLFATPDLLKRDPEGVRKLIPAYLKAASYVMNNRGWSLERITKDFGYSRQAAELIFSSLDYSKDGKIKRQALVNARDFLIEYGMLKREKAPKIDILLAPGVSRL